MLEQIKELRERTNISMAKCKSALESTNGDIEKAIVLLQKQGLADSVKKAGRETKEGVIFSYVHMDKIGVMVEVNAETDFASRSPLFKEFVEQVALQIAATDPLSISRGDLSTEVLTQQTDIVREQAGKAVLNKPEEIVVKILDGKMSKWYSQVCLMEQTSVSESNKTMEQLRAELVAKLGENVVVRRFVRWELGK